MVTLLVTEVVTGCNHFPDLRKMIISRNDFIRGQSVPSWHKKNSPTLGGGTICYQNRLTSRDEPDVLCYNKDGEDVSQRSFPLFKIRIMIINQIFNLMQRYTKRAEAQRIYPSICKSFVTPLTNRQAG